MFLAEPVSYQLIYKLVVVVLLSNLLLTLLSLLGHHFFLELTTHFRLQYLLVSLVCIGVLVAFNSWKLLAIALGCFILNLAYILPYYFTKPHREVQASALHLRLMQVNLLHTNQNFEALIEAINEANADVVVLQELTAEWRDQTRVLSNQYPFNESAPRPGGSGMALISRYPLEEAQILSLDASTYLAVFARVNVEGASISILGLHPPTPVAQGKFANRNRQLSEAGDLLRTIKGPRVLIGDLNTTMWSPYFTDLVRRSGLRDSRLGFGLLPSWPTQLPAFLRLPIDHCLISDEVAVEATQIGRLNGSDHRPLLVDLRFENSALSGRPAQRLPTDSVAHD